MNKNLIAVFVAIWTFGVTVSPTSAWSAEKIQILTAEDESDLKDFAEAAAKSAPNAPSDRFGAVVAAEAQKQRERSKEDRKKFGAFVSEQRRSQNARGAAQSRDLGERGKSAAARSSQAGSSKAHNKNGKGKP